MKLSRIYAVYKEEGLKGVKDRVRSRFYIKMYIYKVNISSIPKNAGEDLKLVALDDTLLEIMHEKWCDELENEKYELLKSRLKEESTDKAYIVMDGNNEICGYYNIAFGENVDRNTNYIIPKEDSNIYLFDDYTFVINRGKGAHKFSIYSRLKLGEELGYKTATVMIDSGNKYSQKSYKKFCFNKVIEVSYYRFFKIKKNVIKNLL